MDTALPLGVFVPDRLVADGPIAVARFVDELMSRFGDGRLVAPYRKYWTRPQTERLATWLGIARHELKQLAEAAMASEAMLQYRTALCGPEVVATNVVSVGATATRLYCVTRSNPNRKHGGYWIGEGPRDPATEGSSRPAGTTPQCEDDRAAAVEGNLAAVSDAMATVEQVGTPYFTSFLTPAGKWYTVPLEVVVFEERMRPWQIWHLRRFRYDHHVLSVSYDTRVARPIDAPG